MSIACKTTSARRPGIGRDDLHDDHRLTVVSTTPEGTIAALRTAGALARNLAARMALVAIEEVPYRLPLAEPLVPIDIRQRQLLPLGSELDCDADEVSIEIFLGRDRKQCLRQILAPQPLVILGGKPAWWSRETKLAHWLHQLGHGVVFADVNRTFSSEAGDRLWGI